MAAPRVPPASLAPPPNDPLERPTIDSHLRDGFPVAKQDGDDLAEALAATLGVKLVVVNKRFAELLPALESGDLDAVMAGMTMTQARNMDVAFAGPYFISGKALLTRSAIVAGFDAPNELDSPTFTLSVLAGTTSQTFASNAMPRAKIIPTETYEDAVAIAKWKKLPLEPQGEKKHPYNRPFHLPNH